MHLTLDFRSGIPIYLQIMEAIKSQIASGELMPGDQLPTVRQMASDLRVNFSTVARAYRLMDEAGLISTQHGRGTYILSPPSEDSAKRLRLQTLQSLTQRYLDETQRLGFTPQEVWQELQAELAQWKNGDPLEDTPERVEGH